MVETRVSDCGADWRGRDRRARQRGLDGSCWDGKGRNSKCEFGSTTSDHFDGYVKRLILITEVVTAKTLEIKD